MTEAPLTLPEELLLLAHDPVRGRPLTIPGYLRYGLAGAALAELEATGRIAVDRSDRITVANPLPLGDPILDGALATLPAPAKGGRAIRAHRWVRQAGRPVQELCLRRLEERGALRREPRRALGLFPYERFPAGATDLTGPARARFKAALDAPLADRRAPLPDPRARLLAAYASAIDLDRKLLPGGRFRPLRRDLRRLAKEEWTANAAFRAVQHDKSAAGGGG
ncbi:GPP34 family phosphoprotein [Streptomyces sp. NPDC020742]|uniref:GOLPH3/VPS74 family protein n=1 Tax=Streptomyces sp. NPDC020742 TaxID=3154897 RepID=UPI0033EE7F4A